MADAGALRDDFGAFSKAVGRPLTPWQVDALTLDVPITGKVAPRQAGKSRSLANLALWFAFRRRTQRVLIVSASEEASRRVLRDILEVAAEASCSASSSSPSRPRSSSSATGRRSGRFRHPSGRYVDGRSTCCSSTRPRSSRTRSSSAHSQPSRPENARIVLASSATVASGAFFDHVKLGEAGTPHVRAIRWALNDCTWITPSAIEVMKGSMSEVRFNAEMLGLWADGASSLFSKAILERATADYQTVTLDDLVGPARVLGGVDWGAHHDRSACVAIGRLPVEGDKPTFAVVMVKRWAVEYPLTDVINELAVCRAHWACLTLERNGLGEPCCQMLARRLRERPGEEGGARPQEWVIIDHSPDRPKPMPPSGWKQKHRAWSARLNPLHANAPQKAATYSALRLLLDAQQLVLPASATELLRELQMLQVDLSASGEEKIEASSGHDDLADALALSMAPYRDASRRWRTILGDLSDPRRPAPPPNPTALAAGGATVTTGAGLAVPAAPIFQSVNGRDVTAPLGLLNSEREPVRVGDFILNTNPRSAA